MEDMCLSQPCHGEAQCSTNPLTGSTLCLCQPGYSGPTCHQDLDECQMGKAPLPTSEPLSAPKQPLQIVFQVKNTIISFFLILPRFGISSLHSLLTNAPPSRPHLVPLCLKDTGSLSKQALMPSLAVWPPCLSIPGPCGLLTLLSSQPSKAPVPANTAALASTPLAPLTASVPLATRAPAVRLITTSACPSPATPAAPAWTCSPPSTVSAHQV